MRFVMRGEPYVNWWVASDCGDVVRICVETPSGGDAGCSSFRDFGWN